eukprot:m51a1_g760 hypothetical protein (412) ;mRNA; f:553761-555164
MMRAHRASMSVGPLDTSFSAAAAPPRVQPQPQQLAATPASTTQSFSHAALLAQQNKELSAALESSRSESARREAMLRAERDDAFRRVGELEAENRQLRQALAARDSLLLSLPAVQPRAQPAVQSPSPRAREMKRKVAAVVASSVVDSIVAAAAERAQARRVEMAVNDTLAGRTAASSMLALTSLPAPVSGLLAALRESGRRLEQAIDIAEESNFALEVSDVARAAAEQQCAVQREEAARLRAETERLVHECSRQSDDAALARCGEAMAMQEACSLRDCVYQLSQDLQQAALQLRLAEMQLAGSGGAMQRAGDVHEERRLREAAVADRDKAVHDMEKLRAQYESLLNKARQLRARNGQIEADLKTCAPRLARHIQVVRSAADELRCVLENTRDVEPLLSLAATLGVEVKRHR